MSWIFVIGLAGLVALGFTLAVSIVYETLKHIWKGIKWAIKKVQIRLYLRKKRLINESEEKK